MSRLLDFMPTRTYSIACAYSGNGIVAQVAGCTIRSDDSLVLHFPKPHGFAKGDRMTVQLDNRTGVELLDIELRVYRASYRGIVSAVWPDRIEVALSYYQLFYGTSVVAENSESAYRFPRDVRPDKVLPHSDLREALLPDEREKENKLGVLITVAEQWPHTTVMAFLSTTEDDIFLISHRGSFKSSLIHREARCCFAIDHRESFLFEKAIDWNFSIFEAETRVIEPAHPLFPVIQGQFVHKNPWEEPFFMDSAVELFHVKPIRLICAGLGTR